MIESIRNLLVEYGPAPLRSAFEREETVRARPERPAGPDYRAVVISPMRGCCRSASDWSGATFLWRQAPRLPLTDCSMSKTCRCTYLKYPDRRHGDDRRQGYSGSIQVERRKRADRRMRAA